MIGEKINYDQVLNRNQHVSVILIFRAKFETISYQSSAKVAFITVILY